MNSYRGYSKTRFKMQKERKIVWKELAMHLQRYINPKSSVLDVGSGYCDFINFIKASKKYALDKYLDPNKFALPNVTKLFGDFSLLEKRIENDSLDVVFASNFFEHLKEEELEKCVRVLKLKLKRGGILIILQPNYRYAYKEYFDDYTHIKAWSDISISDFFKTNGFVIRKLLPRFMPFSMKSKTPKKSFLIRMYLNSPIKPFAKQMLVIAQNLK